MSVRSAAVAGLAILALWPATNFAQATAGEGRTLERRGRYEDAAAIYRAVLQSDPVSVAAWLGLERVLVELERLDSIVPALDSAILSAPNEEFLRELQLRVWSNMQLPDSVTAAAWRWIELDRDNPNPYRQWSHALASAGDADGALAVLEEAGRRLGKAILAPEKAALHGTVGNWSAAAREWSLAIVTSRSNLAAAGLGLRLVPGPKREEVLWALSESSDEPIVRSLSAELLVAWGRPEEGWELLDAALPPDPAEAATELSLFADRLRPIQTKEAARARAYSLERLAELANAQETERARLDAAQAYADAGDYAGARRMLEGLADVGDKIPADAGEAMVTLIRVTAESGRVDEAEDRLRAWEARLRPSDAQRLRERIGWEWVKHGEFDRANGILRSDSSVDALAILGWAALYGGDLRGARGYFLAAGPFAGSRDQATRRTMMLALLQGVEPDTVPALGEALLSLERADTGRALQELERVARDLPANGGRSPVLTLMGDLAKENGDLERAESWFVEALEADSLGPAAPAAEYALGSVLAGRGRVDAATARLEHMILNHPGSALVPEARRLLDLVRGAIPRL